MTLVPARTPTPTMPRTMEEARAKYERWNRLNGRYYYFADVVLDDGRLVHDVCFDADNDTAMIQSSQSDLVGCSIRAFLVTNVWSTPSERVSEEERAAFARAHG